MTTLVFVGGGPRTVSLLERLAANAPELLPPNGLDIHIVDPFPVGGGRIWRRAQSPLLWMNSVAKDVTIFPDESVRCRGPIVPGPPLDVWVAGPGRQVLVDAGLQQEADSLRPHDFASREVMSLYLRWAYQRAVAALPPSVRVTSHRRRAVSVTDIAPAAGHSGPQQRVALDDGTVLTADIVVLAMGYLDRIATATEVDLAAAADASGLTYIPPGYTADIDLRGLRAGQRVLVRGFGLAFIDVQVLVFQGRGGRFTAGADDELVYTPSGAEPVLYVGSRRGVPYHAKLGYSLGNAAPVPPVHFTPAAVAALAGSGRPADFAAELWPLIVKELTHAHYRRLFAVHADRVRGSWTEFAAALDRLDAGGEEFRAMVRGAVPDVADRFDLDAIDRPLHGRRFADAAELAAAVAAYIDADLVRRADPLHSADHAVFNALLTVYGVLAGAVIAGQVSAADRVRYLEGDFHGLFSFLASGPPPRRLAELLALHRAGLVNFAGPDLQVTIDDGRFVGSSPAVPGFVVADALIDARLPRADVRSAADPVIAGLLADGQLAAEDLLAPDGTSLGAGQLLADQGAHAVRADRSVHPRRFLLGPSVSGSAGSAGFARPGFNGPGFRQNDGVARELLQLAGSQPVRPPAPGPADRSESHPIHSNRAQHRIEVSHAR